MLFLRYDVLFILSLIANFYGAKLIFSTQFTKNRFYFCFPIIGFSLETRLIFNASNILIFYFAVLFS